MMTLNNHPQNLSSLADKDFNLLLLNDTSTSNFISTTCGYILVAITTDPLH